MSNVIYVSQGLPEDGTAVIIHYFDSSARPRTAPSYFFEGTFGMTQDIYAWEPLPEPAFYLPGMTLFNPGERT